jgi:hypothetical protein
MDVKLSSVSGPEARAIAVAYAEFAKSGQDIQHFRVYLDSHPDALEVSFVPEPDGTGTRGGSNRNGVETHYWVSKKDYQLQRTTLAR